MKIKRYTATSMRAALAQVRAEQGPDAVILSSRRSDEGIEVIAAVDYDEALFVEATRQRSAASVTIPEPVALAVPAAAARSRAPEASTAAAQAARSAAAPVRAPIPAAPDPGFGAMHREIKDLRQMLETGLAGMTWNDRRLREPLKARVLEELTAMDIAPDVAMALANRAPRRTTLENPSHIPLALLVKHLPVVDDLSIVNGGVIAVVGPTGAGKTTTIAKIAAHWCMRHGSRDLALVSTDGYRIGARDQLLTYARILGAPMHAANTGKELARVLERLKSKKLILIDTAGMGPRDVRLAEQLAALQLGAARARVLLALPAQGEGHALEEIVQAFAPLNPVACILTKVDEAASLGAVISTAVRHRLKIAYVCDGQRVPEDLHAAHEKRIWLVSAARRLKMNAPRRDQAYYARNFGREHAHA
ncbi:MAG TPA: flagellar biosynthesis protein FlhF [Steroidobacteraceae bacterium]|nr:flagellar biosynthesis protein FlhF [Steroidobacteraceae bacterium]